MKDYLLYSIIFGLSFLVPKKKNLLIMGGGEGHQFRGNPKYILLYLRACGQKDLTFFWSAPHAEQRETLRELAIPFINPYSLMGFIKLLRAEYLFIEKSAVDVYYTSQAFGRFRFIQTWHGTPLKILDPDANSNYISKDIRHVEPHRPLKEKLRLTSRQRFYLIPAPTKEVGDILERYFLNPNVVITGYPRNDLLFHPQLAVMDYPAKLEFKNYEKLLLYAPTWRDNNSNQTPFQSDLFQLNELLKRKNYLLIVKKHPEQKNLTIPANLSQIKDVSDQVTDIQELYPFIDLLINDYSSAVFDFILTRKPIIFYPYDLEDYLQNCRGMYMDYFKDQPGPFAKNEEELYNLIDTLEVWAKDSDYLRKYNNFLTRFNKFEDGESSKRLLELLYPRLELPPL